MHIQTLGFEPRTVSEQIWSSSQREAVSGSDLHQRLNTLRGSVDMEEMWIGTLPDFAAWDRIIEPGFPAQQRKASQRNYERRTYLLKTETRTKKSLHRHYSDTGIRTQDCLRKFFELGVQEREAALTLHHVWCLSYLPSKGIYPSHPTLSRRPKVNMGIGTPPDMIYDISNQNHGPTHLYCGS